jgi:hypothetical protein
MAAGAGRAAGSSGAMTKGASTSGASSGAANKPPNNPTNGKNPPNGKNTTDEKKPGENSNQQDASNNPQGPNAGKNPATSNSCTESEEQHAKRIEVEKDAILKYLSKLLEGEKRFVECINQNITKTVSSIKQSEILVKFADQEIYKNIVSQFRLNDNFKMIFSYKLIEQNLQLQKKIIDIVKQKQKNETSDKLFTELLKDNVTCILNDFIDEANNPKNGSYVKPVAVSQSGNNTGRHGGGKNFTIKRKSFFRGRRETKNKNGKKSKTRSKKVNHYLRRSKKNRGMRGGAAGEPAGDNAGEPAAENTAGESTAVGDNASGDNASGDNASGDNASGDNAPAETTAGDNASGDGNASGAEPNGNTDGDGASASETAAGGDKNTEENNDGDKTDDQKKDTNKPNPNNDNNKKPNANNPNKKPKANDPKTKNGLKSNDPASNNNNIDKSGENAQDKTANMEKKIVLDLINKLILVESSKEDFYKIIIDLIGTISGKINENPKIQESLTQTITNNMKEYVETVSKTLFVSLPNEVFGILLFYSFLFDENENTTSFGHLVDNNFRQVFRSLNKNDNPANISANFLENFKKSFLIKKVETKIENSQNGMIKNNNSIIKPQHHQK